MLLTLSSNAVPRKMYVAVERIFILFRRKFAAPALLLSFIFSNASYCKGGITIEFHVLNGVTISENSIIDVELLLHSDVDHVIIWSNVDLPCILPTNSPAAGTIVAGEFTADPDGDSSLGPSSQGYPYLYGAGEFAIYQASSCSVFGIRGTGDAVLLPAGEFRYLGTIRYQVSECSGGAFDLTLENYSSPPQASDTTYFRALRAPNLIPVNVFPTTLTILTGACCLPSGSCEDFGIQCCTGQAGAPGPTGSSCDDDSDGDGLADICDPCPSDYLNDSDNDGACDSADLCPGEDDTIDANNDQVPGCLQKIPTVSSWGLVVLALTLGIASKILCDGRLSGLA